MCIVIIFTVCYAHSPWACYTAVHFAKIPILCAFVVAQRSAVLSLWLTWELSSHPGHTVSTSEDISLHRSNDWDTDMTSVVVKPLVWQLLCWLTYCTCVGLWMGSVFHFIFEQQCMILGSNCHHLVCWLDRIAKLDRWWNYHWPNCNHCPQCNPIEGRPSDTHQLVLGLPC